MKTGTLLTKYTYDKIGQLTRVNDQTDTTADATGTTWVFTYDLGGNILTKKAYAYTTGSVSGLTPTESHTYTYGNAGWKDQLTSFDGTTITYDSIGNPLNDGTWTYTWEHGRQLRQMRRGTGEIVSFEYNEEGLRTKKTAINILHGQLDLAWKENDKHEQINTYLYPIFDLSDVCTLSVCRRRQHRNLCT